MRPTCGVVILVLVGAFGCGRATVTGSAPKTPVTRREPAFPPAPSPEVDEPHAQEVDSDVPGADRVVGAAVNGFVACYNHSLVRDPDDQGTLEITLESGPSGVVTKTSVTVSGGLSASVVSCVQSKCARLRFAKAGRIRFALRFVQST